MGAISAALSIEYLFGENIIIPPVINIILGFGHSYSKKIHYLYC